MARSSGIVTHIEPLSGEALGPGGHGAGREVLISGVRDPGCPQYSELENLGQILVRAQGQVLPDVAHHDGLHPLEAQVKSYTGEKPPLDLSILGYRIDFSERVEFPSLSSDKIDRCLGAHPPGGREMPLAWSRETCRAYTLAGAPVAADRAGRLEAWALEALRARLGTGWCIPASPPHTAGWTAGGHRGVHGGDRALCAAGVYYRKKGK